MTGNQKNLGLDEIVSIEDIGIIDTYDFTIEDTHCFFANNILVHNSLEEDADMIFFINRPGYYDENIDKSISEINLAKHRNGAPWYHKNIKFNQSTTYYFEDINHGNIHVKERKNESTGGFFPK